MQEDESIDEQNHTVAVTKARQYLQYLFFNEKLDAINV